MPSGHEPLSHHDARSALIRLFHDDLTQFERRHGGTAEAAIEALCLVAATTLLAHHNTGYLGELVQIMAEAAIGVMEGILESKDTN